jgi:hypothetical protein
VSAHSTTLSDRPIPGRRNQTAPGGLCRWLRRTANRAPPDLRYALARLAVLLVQGSAHRHARLAGSRSVRTVIIRQQRAHARRDWRAKLGRVGARRISAQRLPRPRPVRKRGGPLLHGSNKLSSTDGNRERQANDNGPMPGNRDTQPLIEG